MFEIESNVSKDFIEKDRFFYNGGALSSQGHDNTMSSLTSVAKNYLFFCLVLYTQFNRFDLSRLHFEIFQISCGSFDLFQRT